jgi:amidophosphoribosyltransferase
MDLAARKAVFELEGETTANLEEFADCNSDRHCAMVDCIAKRLGLSSLRYQKLGDLVEAIGLPKERLCTYCWDGVEG